MCRADGLEVNEVQTNRAYGVTDKDRLRLVVLLSSQRGQCRCGFVCHSDTSHGGVGASAMVLLQVHWCLC